MVALGLLAVKVNQVARYVCDVPFVSKNLTLCNYCVIIAVYSINRVLMVIQEMLDRVAQKEVLERRYSISFTEKSELCVLFMCSDLTSALFLGRSRSTWEIRASWTSRRPWSQGTLNKSKKGINS